MPVKTFDCTRLVEHTAFGGKFASKEEIQWNMSTLLQQTIIEQESINDNIQSINFFWTAESTQYNLH